MTLCISPTGADRRRTFWTTQPSACGTEPSCTGDCGRPGLQLTSSSCGRFACSCCPDPTLDPNCPATPRPMSEVPRSFVTNDWVRSLVLNILMTDARKPNTRCGYRPGAQGGHWSDSFRTDGLKSGSTIRDLPKSTSIRDSVALVRATLQADLAKLVTTGIASAVNVSADYLGSNIMAVNIEVVGPTGTSARVGLTGSRSANAWAWN